MGLRGGTWSISFSDVGATIHLSGSRFAEDVAVTGEAVLPFGVVASLDATVTVDGPAGEDGTLTVTGLVFSPGARKLVVRGTLAGRNVALLVPAT